MGIFSVIITAQEQEIFHIPLAPRAKADICTITRKNLLPKSKFFPTRVPSKEHRIKWRLFNPVLFHSIPCFKLCLLVQSQTAVTGIQNRPNQTVPFQDICTVKILKFGTPQTIAIIVLKIEKFDVTLH